MVIKDKRGLAYNGPQEIHAQINWFAFVGGPLDRVIYLLKFKAQTGNQETWHQLVTCYKISCLNFFYKSFFVLYLQKKTCSTHQRHKCSSSLILPTKYLMEETHNKVKIKWQIKLTVKSQNKLSNAVMDATNQDPLQHNKMEVYYIFKRGDTQQKTYIGGAH